MRLIDYYNRETKERKWAKEMDPDLIQMIQQEALKKAESKHLLTEKGKDNQPVGNNNDEELPLGWKCTIDKETNMPYYYNKQTKQTSWVRPS